ncbi:hypothetical protein D3C86_1439900 [compost metagenome]
MVEHVERHIDDDHEAEVGNPAIAVQELGDEVGGEAHQRDRYDEADDQHRHVFLRSAGDGKDVVQRHGDVGDDDLGRGLEEGLVTLGQVGLFVGHLVFDGTCGVTQFRPHLPAHPGEQQSAEQLQADNGKKLDGDGGKADAQNRGGDDADQDRLAAKMSGQTGGGKADDDGVVARQNEVDCNDLQKCRETGGCEDFHGIVLKRIEMSRGKATDRDMAWDGACAGFQSPVSPRRWNALKPSCRCR